MTRLRTYDGRTAALAIRRRHVALGHGRSNDRSVSTFEGMDDAAFVTALRQIITTSYSTDEVQRRVWGELGYPDTIAIDACQPITAEDFEASVLVHLLGGLHLASGAIVIVMAYGPSGVVISL